jgi:hypothetical protein
VQALFRWVEHGHGRATAHAEATNIDRRRETPRVAVWIDAFVNICIASRVDEAKVVRGNQALGDWYLGFGLFGQRHPNRIAQTVVEQRTDADC